MKIQLASDVHLEFGSTSIKNNGSDTLILSGDICVADFFTKQSGSRADRADEARKFFCEVSSNFKNVIYVPGNHEHYHSFIHKVSEILIDVLKEFSNIHFLQNGHAEIDGINFIGATLWTDCKRNDPLVEMSLNNCMNDFNCVSIKDGPVYRKFKAYDSTKLHAISKNFIKETVMKLDNVVVVTHHAPSEQSVHEIYASDQYINPGYFSNLEEFIMDLPQIKLWTHGHMHNYSNYKIADTQIVCNPVGYPGQETGYNENLILEV
jgi:Icc-related predicted phosphoesterase